MPVMVAISQGRLDLVDWLLDRDACSPVRDSGLWLMKAAQREQWAALGHLLDRLPAQVDWPDRCVEVLQFFQTHRAFAPDVLQKVWQHVDPAKVADRLSEVGDFKTVDYLAAFWTPALRVQHLERFSERELPQIAHIERSQQRSADLEDLTSVRAPRGRLRG